MAFKDYFVPYPDTPAEIAKAIVYMFLGGAGALLPALTDNVITNLELVQAAIIFIGLIPVYIFGSNVAKTASVAVIAGLQVIAGTLAQAGGWGDITLSTWLTVFITAFAAIGVFVTPNKSPAQVDPVAVVNTVQVSTSDIDQEALASEVSRTLEGQNRAAEDSAGAVYRPEYDRP